MTPGDARSLAGGGCNGRCFFANLNSLPMRACARNELSCDVVFPPRLPVIEFLFRGLHCKLSLQGIICLTSNWKGYRAFFTIPGNPAIEDKWTKQANLGVIDNHNYYISIKEVSHMLVKFEVDGRSSDTCLLSYTEAGLSNDVLQIPSIHLFDCLYYLTLWDIVSLVILRGIDLLVISWDIHSLTIL